jgi:hypothetical protein
MDDGTDGHRILPDPRIRFSKHARAMLYGDSSITDSAAQRLIFNELRWLVHGRARHPRDVALVRAWLADVHGVELDRWRAWRARADERAATPPDYDDEDATDAGADADDRPTPAPLPEKVCATCGIERTLGHFRRRLKSPDLHDATCHECTDGGAWLEWAQGRRGYDGYGGGVIVSTGGKTRSKHAPY